MSKTQTVEYQSSPIARTNRMFINISALGECDSKGKLVFSKSFKRIVAAPDRPLMMFAGLLDNAVIPSFSYSSKDAAVKDLQQFKEWVAGLKVEGP